MADKKISQLGATTTPVNADLFAIVQSGVTKKITYQNLLNAIIGEADLAQVLTTGNITGGNNIEITLNDLIKSAAAGQTQIDFGAAGDNFHVTTDGGAEGEGYIGLRTSSSIIGFLNEYLSFNTSNVKLKATTQTEFDSPIYKFTQLTASTIPYLDASKNLVSSAITPTELGYLTGASSNLQSQIDALVTGLSWKQAVRVATTGPGTLASDFENGDTIDGVILITGDRILIKDQAAATENGIYVVNASGAPTRASDMNVASEFPSATVAVSAGTTNADTQWVCTNDAVIIGITNITFVAVGGTTYVGTTNKITVTGNVIDVGAYVLLSDGSVPLIANWDAGDFEIKFTDFKAKTSSGGSLVSSGGNDCFSFGIGGGATNTVFGALKLDYSTASRVMVTDASKNLIASSVTDTTLSYLDATSSIQTQLDSKVFTIEVGGLSLTSPADSTTYYLSDSAIMVPQTANSTLLSVVPFNCILIAVTISTRIGNVPTNENSSFGYSKNGGAFVDYTTTYSFTTTQGTQLITGLSESFSAGDTIAHRWVTPAWVTNPNNTVLSIKYYFRPI